MDIIPMDQTSHVMIV